MRALVYTEARTLEVLDVPSPAVRPGELVVRVGAAGICGSDVHGVASRSPRRSPPLVMGHEFAGEVVETGDGVPPDLLGRQVAINPQIPCGRCTVCRSGHENVCQQREFVGGSRPGGFAELVAVPLRCVHELPDDVDHAVASLAEPLATCVHAASLIGSSVPSRAVVFGAGTIGVLAAQTLRLVGTGWIAITDVDPARRAEAAAVADVALDPAELDDALAEQGGAVDVCIDAAGTSGTRHTSVAILEPRGTAVWLGMHDQDSPVPAFDMVVREQRVQGAFAYTNPEFARAVGLLTSGQFKPAVSSTIYPLEQSAGAFEALVNGQTNGVLKTIVAPGGNPP